MRSQAYLDELRWRQMLFQHTEGIGDALDAGTVTGYAGFDPTAPSLHVGNLVPVMGLLHLQRHGHRPIAVVGGGTGLIGDPSGRPDERALADRATVDENTRRIQSQLMRFLDFDGDRAARMVNNADWLLELRAVDFMRDVGKHFTVNYMLQKDSVKSRMDAGISYTEFSYMLLQAYDYLELFRRHGVTLQVGGSDQWGNITAGAELIRRTTGGEAHAITFPLVMTAAGTKFGKTAGGAVWLDPAMTTPYKFFQFWINVDDRDAGLFLRYFTLLTREEIEGFDRGLADRPEARDAQRALARDMTVRVHGTDGADTAEEVSGLLFGGLEPARLSARAFASLAREIPTFESTAAGTIDTAAVLDAVTGSDGGLFKSKGDAKRMVQQGGVYINGTRISVEPEPVALLHGEYVLVRKGARSYALVRFVGLRT